MNYFDYSQAIRNKIAASPQILEKTRGAFEDRFEPFTAGGTVNLYFLGRLESGLYVALRTWRKEMLEGKLPFEKRKKNLEIYCRNAEDLSDKGENVPCFCVGVIYKNSVGIFTEDLTAGETKVVTHYPDNDYGFVNDKKIWIDIDYLFNSKHLGAPLSYFAEDHIIQL